MRQAGVSVVILIVLAAVTAGAARSLPARAAAVDGWLTTRADAEKALPSRFKNIATVACTPDKTSGTRVIGTVRWWQRLWCSGTTYDRLGFKLRFDVMGQCAKCWTITHLTGLLAAHLKVKHTGTPATKSSGNGGSSAGPGTLIGTASDEGFGAQAIVDGTANFWPSAFTVRVRGASSDDEVKIDYTVTCNTSNFNIVQSSGGWTDFIPVNDDYDVNIPVGDLESCDIQVSAAITAFDDDPYVELAVYASR